MRYSTLVSQDYELSNFNMNNFQYSSDFENNGIIIIIIGLSWFKYKLLTILRTDQYRICGLRWFAHVNSSFGNNSELVL